VSRLARAASLVFAATFVSRVLGLVRDILRGALIGASRLSDALDVAFKVPNLLRDLFAEGAFSGAFVPTLSRARERGGDEAAFALLNRVLSTLLVYVGAVVVLIVIGAPGIVSALSPSFAAEPGVHELAVVLVRLLAPFLLFISLAVACMGALNVFGRFFLPALSPATQNVVLVLGGVLLLQLGLGRGEAALPWAVLLLLGGLTQLAVQLPALWRIGWRPRFRPDLAVRFEETREILRRMLPVAGGLAATHVSILINTRLATAHAGGTSNLYYAFRLVHLPVGLVGVAVGTAVLAEASRRAARGDEPGVRDTLAEALLLAFAFCAPAAVGLAVLGGPIADLLFGWGAMRPDEVAAIGETIRYFAVAVVFYASVKVVAPVFYAQGRVRVPLVASLIAVGANLVCALALHPVLAWRGLALAVGAGQAANLGVLLWVARRSFGGPSSSSLVAAAKILVAAGCCGTAAALVAPWMPAGTGLGARIAAALGPVAAGGAVYFVAGGLLRCREIVGVLSRARLDRGRTGP
jgi:putative peptidoglycan lipid II flippase